MKPAETTSVGINRPIPNFFVPLFQKEPRAKHYENQFDLHKNKLELIL